MNAEEAGAVPVETATFRDLAVARGLDQARSRAERRVEMFLDAARELMNTNSGEFTVQEVVERSGQSLRTFYQYFAGKHELLLALFEESIRAAAAHLHEVVAAEGAPLERLRLFTVEYYRMCRIAPKGEPRVGPAPTMVEFAQQLLTSHPTEAAEAFAPLVVALEALLDDAAAAGEIRAGLDHRRIAGVVLQATMFNTFAAAISGAPTGPGGAAESGILWDVLLRGIGVPDGHHSPG
jgi:AcrR family transcriptional regulator